jgi:hypothetical protein
MARGWESKSVEIQIEEADSAAKPDSERKMRMGAAEVRSKREGLMLQRSRILQEMEAARNPRYQTMLNEMLNHVEQELAGLTNK